MAEHNQFACKTGGAGKNIERLKSINNGMTTGGFLKSACALLSRPCSAFYSFSSLFGDNYKKSVRKKSVVAVDPYVSGHRHNT